MRVAQSLNEYLTEVSNGADPVIARRRYIESNGGMAVYRSLPAAVERQRELQRACARASYDCRSQAAAGGGSYLVELIFLLLILHMIFSGWR